VVVRLGHATPFLQLLDGGAAQQTSRRRLDELIVRLEQTPGVERAVQDIRGRQELGVYLPDERGRGEARHAELAAVRAPAGYFDALGLPVLRGREFGTDDARPDVARADVPVVIGVDLAARLWPGADPVGRRLRPADDPGAAAGTTRLLVVGVIEDPQARVRPAREAYRVFLPADPDAVSFDLLVRTRSAAHTQLPRLRSVIQAVLPDMIVDARTLEDVEAVGVRHFRTVTAAVSAAGLAALLLSAIGLYAVIAFAAGQRHGEIAVRIAVGAKRAQIARQFLGDGVRLSAIGVALGLPVSLLGLHFLMAYTGVVVGVLPVALVAAGAVLGIATAAVAFPARRAAAIDPAVTLRRT
jgi:hypothetical protein